MQGKWQEGDVSPGTFQKDGGSIVCGGSRALRGGSVKGKVKAQGMIEVSRARP